MKPSQFSLSLPLRIVRLEGGAEIQEANGRRICFCDEYDAPQLVRSVNSFPELLAICNILAVQDYGLGDNPTWTKLLNPMIQKARQAIANTEREEQKV